MQPLPTETAPRSVCAQCGAPLPPPNGSATFVYGVGAVGYQSCAACGAKWRYLWRDRPAARIASGRGRLFVGLAALALVVVVGVAAVAFARSQPWRSGTTPATKAGPVVTPATSARPPSGAPLATGADYLPIMQATNGARKSFMQWLAASGLSTPQYLVEQRVSEFVRAARADLQALRGAHWPDAAAGDVAKLVDADQTFIDDVDLIRFGFLNSPSFADKLQTEARAVRAADASVRHDLRLPPAVS